MPAPAPPDKWEEVKDVYWRLNQPMSGTLLEAYWPSEDDWLPVKFMMVPEDARVRVKWVQGGAISELPSHYVRNLGDLGDEDPPMKRYLRSARPDWNDWDLRTVVEKLKAVGLFESRMLYEAVLDETHGHSDGVNALLRASRQKVLVPRTLNALKVTGEQIFGRRRLRPQDSASLAPKAPEPREIMAEARRAAAAAQRDDKLDLHEDDPPPPPKHDARREDSPPPTQHRSPQDAAPPPKRPQPAAPPPAQEPDLINDDSFLASQVCCGKGHSLSKEATPYDVNCDDCGAELDEGATMWRCDPCAYDLCCVCHEVRRRKAGGLRAPQRRPQASPLHAGGEARPPAAGLPPKPQDPAVYCPKRHPLKHQHPSHPVECSYCGKEVNEKIRAWLCARCGYHLCEACHEDRAMD